MFRHTAFAMLISIGQISAAAWIFEDNFDNGVSPLWGNEVGSWSVNNGHYDASSIIFFGPLTYSSLPFNLTDFSVELKVDRIGDGGIWLRSSDPQNGVLLVTGGDGFGPWGNNIFGSGDRLYFHIVENSSITSTFGYAETRGIITRRTGDYVVKVNVVGNQYQAFLDDQLILTMIDDTFASGKVALYDNYLFGQSNDYVRVSPLMSTIDVRLDDFGPSGVMGYRFNGADTIYGSAGQFQIDTKKPVGSDAQGVSPHALGFCIELTQNFSSDFHHYVVGDVTSAQDPVGIAGPISPERAALIEQLWALHYDSDWKGSGPYSFADITRSMAFSALLYEIIYDFDGVTLASMDLRSGLFELVDGFLLDKNDPTQELPILDVASYFLTTLSLDYSGPKPHLLALTNSTHQDYLVAVVPEVDSRILTSCAFCVLLSVSFVRQLRTTPRK
jgi:hypothetical protein